MKKFLVMFAIAGTLVACNNASETETNTDSTTTTTTTPVEVTPTTDSITVPVVVDSPAVVVDTTKK